MREETVAEEILTHFGNWEVNVRCSLSRKASRITIRALLTHSVSVWGDRPGLRHAAEAALMPAFLNQPQSHLSHYLRLSFKRHPLLLTEQEEHYFKMLNKKRYFSHVAQGTQSFSESQHTVQCKWCVLS